MSKEKGGGGKKITLWKQKVVGNFQSVKPKYSSVGV